MTYWLLSIFLFILLGFLCLLVFSAQQPRLRRAHKKRALHRISVIIIVKNNENDLPALLTDLQNQSNPPADLICVDLQSSDQSVALARQLGAQVYQAGPSKLQAAGLAFSARQLGAQHARGELLLFLEPNLRLDPDALLSLSHAYEKNQRPLSIRPYHQMRRSYEHLSLFIDFFAAFRQGVGLHSNSKQVHGLFGSCLLISPSDWMKMFPAACPLSLAAASGRTLPKVIAEELGIPLAAVAGADWSPEGAPNELWSDVFDNRDEIDMQTSQNRPSLLLRRPASNYTPPSIVWEANGRLSISQLDSIADEVGFWDASAPPKPSKQAQKERQLQSLLYRHRIPTRLLLGSNLVRYRYQPSGLWRFIGQCVQSDAEKESAPALHLRLLQWISLLSLLLSAAMLVYAFYAKSTMVLLFASILYVLIFLLLSVRSQSVGKFHVLACLLYPLPLLFYCVVGMGRFFRHIHPKTARGQR